MKRFLALLLTFSFLLVPCGHRQVRAEAVVDISFADEVTGMNDPRLLPYLEDAIYASLVADLNSEEYFVENVQAVYISQEYLDEVAYNSQANIFFGYTLAELDAQFDGAKYVFTLGDDGSTVVEPFVEYYDDTYDRILRNVAVGTGVILICVTVSVVSKLIPTVVKFNWRLLAYEFTVADVSWISFIFATGRVFKIILSNLSDDIILISKPAFL